MPGLLPYVKLGDKPSDIGKAVALLTGLAPLRGLSSHAKKAKEKLQKELPQDRQAEIDVLNGRYDAERGRLIKLCEKIPALPIDVSRLPTSTQEDAKDQLLTLKNTLQTSLTTSFSEAKTLLGQDFDPSQEKLRNQLQTDIPVAISMCKPQALVKLRCLTRISGLRQLSEAQLSDAEALLLDLRTTAVALVERELRPLLASRIRLYAAVGTWLRSQKVNSDFISSCPLCAASLQDKIDPVTNEHVSRHLQEELARTSAAFSGSIKEWVRDARKTLDADLPEALRAELRSSTDCDPRTLLSTSLIDELFGEECFSGPLNSLKTNLSALAATLRESLPNFVVTEFPDLPQEITDIDAGFRHSLARVHAAIAAARWRRNSDHACKLLFSGLLGLDIEATTAPREVGEALLDKLKRIDTISSVAAPTTEASAHVETLLAELTAREKIERTQSQYALAADSMDSLIGLGDLVDHQLSSLRTTLQKETTSWKRDIYIPAVGNSQSPQFESMDISRTGVVTFNAVQGGTSAPVHEIGNASDVRATLVGFLFAFWNHVFLERGGLRLLLLDDPQELFDPDNRRRMANALPALVDCGARPVVTTNDIDFANRIARAGALMDGKSSGEPKSIRLEIKPAGVGRASAKVSLHETALDRKRRDFEVNETTGDEHEAARNYAQELRIWLEGQFADFLAPSTKLLAGDPTLSELVEAFRSRHRAGMEAISGPKCRALARIPALLPNSAALELLNRAHHRQRHTISYGEVAEREGDFVAIQRATSEAHDELEWWLLRDEPACQGKAPDPQIAGVVANIPQRNFSVPIYRDLAAATSTAIDAGNDIEEESFSSQWFSDKALFRLGSDNFGFSAPRGSVAVVTVDDSPIEDSRLVIAYVGSSILARRLHRDQRRPDVLVLSSDAENPLHRPPTRVSSPSECGLLRVVGILFEDSPPLLRISGDAEAVPDSKALDSIKMAFRVRNESALPLAIAGQLVLAGQPLAPSSLGSLVGEIVALDTDDGQQVLKRVGEEVQGMTGVRRFESIGGLGSSLVIYTGDGTMELGTIPRVRSLRRILGVIYTNN